MKKKFTECILLILVFLSFIYKNNYGQMPPHPSLLEKIKRGEQAAPYSLKNLQILRNKGIDAAWSSPGIEMPQNLKQNNFSRTLGPQTVPSGSWKALAILVQFTDKASQVNINYFDNLLFGQSAGTLHDYYNKVSYGNLDIVTVNLPSVVGWVTAPKTYSYYVNNQNGTGNYPQNTQKLVEDIVNLVNPQIDFSQYDNDGDGYVDALFILHSGPGAEYTGHNYDIWSHAWTTSTPQNLDGVKVYHYSIEPEYWLNPGDMTCGVFAHEMGHAAFGLPDLYDTDNSSEGLGNWSLMAGGSWNGSSGLGSSPAFPDAWSHIQMGYITPTIVSSNITGQIINNIENTSEAYFLQNSLCGTEYFLVENRQKTSYDTYLPGNGLCIYHIDNSVNNNNNEWYPGHTSSGHYHAALEQADGLWNLEHNSGRGDAGDTYPGSTNNISFNNSSIPDSKNYGFNETDIAVSNILSSTNYTMKADFYIQENTSERITITYPVGGEVFAIGSNPLITYTSTGTSGRINLDYSIDGGVTWSVISTNQPDIGSYNGWTIPNTPSTSCKIKISDVDGYPSVISKGLFIIGSTQFSEQRSITVTGVNYSSVAWGDYDNDGYLDILLSGVSDNGIVSKIYHNNGNNTFTEQTTIPLTGLANGSAAWGDYDNDGDLDILLTGTPDYGSTIIANIYRNNGNNTFTEQTSIVLPGVEFSSVEWGDYDNDGDLDFLLTGLSLSVPHPVGGGAAVSRIYHNNGNNTFTEQTAISLTNVDYGSVAWGDYDNDGYLDIILTGASDNGRVSKIYHNNGNNTFTEQTTIPLTGVAFGSAKWGDYDNDGYLDILLTGSHGSGPEISKIYRNNGNNTFTDQTNILLTGVWGGSAAWGDYDNDGYLDIFLTGLPGLVSKLYRNGGNNTFEDQTSIYFTPVGNSVAWGDYNNDGNLDLLLAGFDGNNRFSKIYKNNNLIPNTPPTVPTNLKAAVNGNNVTFSWDKSTDNETLQNGLTYNLVVGTSPGACDILSPMSDINTGKRKIVSMGNAGHCNSKTIKGLPDRKYYWSVQAIDNCFEGSQFAPEQIVFTNCSLDLHPEKYELSSLNEGNIYYIDRDYILSTVPDEYKGYNMIRTANDDKTNTNVNLHFNLCSSTDVYIAYDHRISVPSWLSDDYDNTNETIEVTDANLQYFNIWKRKQPAQPGVITFGDNEEDDESSMYFVFYKPSETFEVNIKVFLQGAYSSGSMSTTLNSGGCLPANQPYNISPWNYTGKESVSWDPYFFKNNTSIVDWVLLQLRTATIPGNPSTATNIIAQRAAFLKSDGTIVDIDGTNPVVFWGTTDGSYYIVVKHRNHLAVMSSDVVELKGITTYDFTTSESQAYIKDVGAIPMANLGGGKYGMYEGDTDASGVVDVLDRANAWNNRNHTGVYVGSDTDLSSVVDVIDRANTWNNRNIISQVP